MASVQGQGQGVGGKRLRVVDVLGAVLAETTRFQASDLKEASPEQDSSAELIVTTRQRVELDLAWTEGHGRLPQHITARPDATVLQAELEQSLAAAESGATASIQHWATQEPGRYRRLLTGGTLFGDPLRTPLGTEWPCATCGQRGHLPCAGCAGRGARVCADCQGHRRCPCQDCRGLGRRACSVCEGRGQRPGPVATSAPPDTPVPLVDCAACSQGWLPCTRCASQGDIPCARCAASGQMVCPDCAGEQTGDCRDCGATGWLHRWGHLREHLETQDLLDVHHPDPATAAAVATRYQQVEALDTACLVEQVRYTTAPMAVQAIHRLRLPVRHARLLVAGQAMEFTALGPALDVVDRQNIAAVLLAHDLATLEKNAAGSGHHLADALQRFLQSPLNRELAARTPPAEIDKRFPGLVDSTYQQSATVATQRAVERLWLQAARRPRLHGLAGTAVVAGLAVVLGSPQWGIWGSSILGLTTGVAGWTVADWQLRRRLAQTLRIPQGDRLLRPLRQSAVVRRWQVTSLAAAVLVAVASAASMTQLPHVRTHAAQAQASATLSRQLDAWWSSAAGPDLRLRPYPDAALLASATQTPQAEPRARLVRAWQLLLGTGGVAADPGAAERMLEGLDRHTELAGSIAIAQARASVALRARSASAMQAAAAALETLPEPLPSEALYTLALVQLTPVQTGRGSGTAKGLATLQQAADLGHASACFELGRRLALGLGLRRDLVAARRYLGYADAKGVPGAAQALTALH